MGSRLVAHQDPILHPVLQQPVNYVINNHNCSVSLNPAAARPHPPGPARPSGAPPATRQLAAGDLRHALPVKLEPATSYPPQTQATGDTAGPLLPEPNPTPATQEYNATRARRARRSKTAQKHIAARSSGAPAPAQPGMSLAHAASAHDIARLEHSISNMANQLLASQREYQAAQDRIRLLEERHLSADSGRRSAPRHTRHQEDDHASGISRFCSRRHTSPGRVRKSPPRDRRSRSPRRRVVYATDDRPRSPRRRSTSRDRPSSAIACSSPAIRTFLSAAAANAAASRPHDRHGARPDQPILETPASHASTVATQPRTWRPLSSPRDGVPGARRPPLPSTPIPGRRACEQDDKSANSVPASPSLVAPPGDALAHAQQRLQAQYRRMRSTPLMDVLAGPHTPTSSQLQLAFDAADLARRSTRTPSPGPTLSPDSTAGVNLEEVEEGQISPPRSSARAGASPVSRPLAPLSRQRHSKPANPRPARGAPSASSKSLPSGPSSSAGRRANPPDVSKSATREEHIGHDCGLSDDDDQPAPSVDPPAQHAAPPPRRAMARPLSSRDKHIWSTTIPKRRLNLSISASRAARHTSPPIAEGAETSTFSPSPPRGGRFPPRDDLAAAPTRQNVFARLTWPGHC